MVNLGKYTNPMDAMGGWTDANVTLMMVATKLRRVSLDMGKKEDLSWPIR